MRSDLGTTCRYIMTQRLVSNATFSTRTSPNPQIPLEFEPILCQSTADSQGSRRLLIVWPNSEN